MKPRLHESHWPATSAPYSADITIGDALGTAKARWSNKVAVIEGLTGEGGRSWTFAELESNSRKVAHALLSRFRPGERIAVWATNRPEWLLLQFGAALAGLTLVTVNPAYGRQEVEFVLGQSRANGLFVEPTVRSRDLLEIATDLGHDLPDLRFVASFSEWDEFLVDAQTDSGDLPIVNSSDPAQVQYTSGTTGFPKGALLAHRGLALNGHLYADAIGAGAEDVWINPMPLFHTAGCGLVTLGALQTGGTHVLPRSFDADLMLDLFEKFRGTLLLSVPTMLIRMLDAQRARHRDVRSWKLATLGGAQVPAELVRRAERELGVDVAIGFGQTEASPYITHTSPKDLNPEWVSTVGQPLPLVEVKIAGDEIDRPAPLNTAGEICTRGPCVMLEYLDNPEATLHAIDQDGWLHTGDIGTMDESGYVRVEGRLKDMIIRGGENIYPREIEELIFSHGGVINVAVVGVPDDEWGEVLAAFVQVRSEAQLDQDELEQYCRDHLAGYKVPRLWQFVTDFPQTSSGKIQKYELRRQYLEQTRN